MFWVKLRIKVLDYTFLFSPILKVRNICISSALQSLGPLQVEFDPTLVSYYLRFFCTLATMLFYWAVMFFCFCFHPIEFNKFPFIYLLKMYFYVKIVWIIKKICEMFEESISYISHLLMDHVKMWIRRALPLQSTVLW